MIHLNLFLSFILRAAMSTIKENLLVQNIGFAGDVGYVDNTTLYFKEGPVSISATKSHTMAPIQIRRSKI